MAILASLAGRNFRVVILRDDTCLCRKKEAESAKPFLYECVAYSAGVLQLQSIAPDQFSDT